LLVEKYGTVEGEGEAKTIVFELRAVANRVLCSESSVWVICEPYFQSL